MHGSVGKMFWAEIAPAEHVVQFYRDERLFLDTLVDFVAAGLSGGEAVIVIATGSHLEAVQQRLRNSGVDLKQSIADEQYLPMEAESLLGTFMVDGWPDEERFKEVIMGALGRARRGGRRVRAFGELVALLWARGENGATVHLEHLWHKLCHAEDFALFCAYPRIGWTQEMSTAMGDICALHSRVITESA